jgi:hypothetical protein
MSFFSRRKLELDHLVTRRRSYEQQSGQRWPFVSRRGKSLRVFKQDDGTKRGDS